VLTRRTRARRKRILGWPIVAANFRSGWVSCFGVESGDFLLEVEFSYRVEDSEHSGEYIHHLRTEEEARNLLRSLKRGPFYIRYDPASPSEYVVDPYRDVWVPQQQEPPPEHNATEVM
jgi:hypothetical protein